MCLALALLAMDWTLPREARADAYALHTVNTVADTLKPNVLVVLETAESMQGLPGENAARYNEVGADCEDGSRQCRLVGQVGRWSFSGMGQNGMYFGNAPASCTKTQTYTYPSTITTSTTSTTSTTTQTTVTTTMTSSGTQSGTATGSASNTATASGTASATGTATASRSASANWTVTASNSLAAVGTSTVTSTGAAASQTIAGTSTKVASLTRTASGTVTLSETVTVVKTATLTGTVTGPATVTETANISATGTTTASATVTVTGSVTAMGTVTATGSATATGTVTASMTVTLSGGGTMTSTGTSTGTVAVSKSATATGTVVTTASATALGTKVITQTFSATGSTTSTGTATATGTVTATSSATAAGTVTALVTGGGTANDTSHVTSTPSGTSTATATATYSSTGSSAFTWTFNGTGTFRAQSTDSGTSITAPPCQVLAFGGGVVSATGVSTGTSTQSVTTTASATQVINNLPWASTFVTTSNTRSTITVTATWTGTSGLQFGSGVWTGTKTTTSTHASASATTTNTAAPTATLTSTHANTGTACGTVTGSATVTLNGTVTGTPTVTGTGTVTKSFNATGTDTVLATATLTGTGNVSGNVTVTATGNVTGSTTATGTGVVHTTTSTTTTTNITTTYTITATVVATGTQTISTCGFQGSTDPNACNMNTPTTNGFCNANSGINCATDGACTSVKGDFCQAISSIDGSGRPELSEICVSSAGASWGSCKHGVVTANTTCTSSVDNSCNAALPGDYCAEGLPAKMCSDSGLWCVSDAHCHLSSTTDKCAPASSRMMITKRALRRAIADHADKVNFGFMNTYQGRGVPATATDASTAIFPYVKLQPSSGLTTITETRFIARGELTDADCFSLANGPSSSCTIDYGGDGAINDSHPELNQVTYTLVGANDSRWGIPRGDGSGKSNHQDASWSSCSTSPILPACEFSQGTGLYEGSYYKFTYGQGTPVANLGFDGEGSRAHPIYFSAYKGKYYSDGINGYNAVDAERTDSVSDGIYGRPAYTGHPYDPANEVPVPWSGASNSATCDATTGAVWNQNVVPFLTDATFGGKDITREQKTLMTLARLDKASFGGVDATGKVAPIGCALGDAQNYLTTVKSNDAAHNLGGKTPCWSNNIVLVVDGWANGPGDMGANMDCASAACIYNSTTNPSLVGCNCTAITKAFSLAHSSPPVQTHVVVNAPASWKDSAQTTAYYYLYAFMWNLALAGSPNFDGTPSFGTSEDEVYKAVSDKIAVAAYHFPYTTTVPVTGATTQDPTSLILTPSNFLYDTSVSYPAWTGNLRAFDMTSFVDLKWDAVTVASQGYPADWTKRRVFFSNKDGAVIQVQINNDGTIGNKADLNIAKLGATSDEAERIMQWLLGKPELGNPAPLMGSITSSTPIAVGQAAANGLNGSSDYSTNTWKRPQLVYVGADDGMLHAFFGHAGSKVLGGTAYQGGEEAFAFIPFDMLPVITKLYAQGGQKLAVDKSEHIFGLAGSPKVKDMCSGLNCDTSTGSDWRTVLVMPEGPDGNKPFALDITNVVDEENGLRPNQMSLLWNPGVKLAAGAWETSLGETTSTPAFYFSPVGPDNNRVLFASGYPTTSRSKTGYDSQGLVLLDVDALNGKVVDTQSVLGKGTTNCVFPTPPTSRTLLADVSLARDYSSLSTSQRLMAAYVVDTFGNTFQYVPTVSDPTKVLANLYSLGCGQPLYFAPAVVQLDRAPRFDTSAKKQIYLVQVTNSNLDPDTEAFSSTFPDAAHPGFPGSQLVVTKLDGNVSPPVVVTSYNPFDPGGLGQIVLSTDPNANPSNRICLQPTSNDNFTDGTKSKLQSCAQAGGTLLPPSARPVGTPTVVLRSDGLGFQVITSWYDPTAMANDCSAGNSFSPGKSYITVHEFGADGSWYQIAGVGLANTVLTGATFVGTGLFVDGINAGATPQGLNIGETFTLLQQILNNNGPERYSRTAWTERM
jgi:hypothetical protein